MKNNINEISRIYEKRRFDALFQLEDRRTTLYKKFPKLEEIDSRIKLLGIEMSKSAISGNTEERKQLEEKIFHIKEEKKNFLREKSIPESELFVKYFCEKCSDTGFIGTGSSMVKCSCYRTLIIEKLYKNFTLDSNQSMVFEKFDINFYSHISDKKRYGTDVSPKKLMMQNYNICRKFADNFGDTSLKNLLISGTVGVGKTFMCACIANELIRKGIPVLYLSSTDIFNIITASRMGKFAEIANGPQISDLINAELLIIDDLGTESLTESRNSEFLEILNKKKEICGKRPCHIIISTNLTQREIYKRYSERIGSRLFSEFNFLKFAGDDIRMIDRTK